VKEFLAFRKNARLLVLSEAITVLPEPSKQMGVTMKLAVWCSLLLACLGVWLFVLYGIRLFVDVYL